MIRLNNKGIAHLFIPLFFIMGIAVIGTYFLVSSHADAPLASNANAKLPPSIKIGPSQNISVKRTSLKQLKTENISQNTNTSSAVYSSGQAISPHWSGYVDQGGGNYTEVQSTYIQPTVACTVANSWTTFWVGMDGWSNGSVEQSGTMAYCTSAGRAPQYYAWWEMYPSNAIQYMTIAIHPGDKIHAQVNYSAGQYNLGVSDLSDGQSYSKPTNCTYSAGCQNSSAEWIIERAGSYGTNPVTYFPLGDYGTMTLNGDDAAVNGGAAEPVNNNPNYQVNMVEGSSNTLATTSPLGVNGDSFTGTYVDPSGPIWQGYESLGQPSVGAEPGDTPVVASWGSGHLDVFETGADHALWHKWYDVSTGWSTWQSLGGYITSSPGVTSWGVGHLDVFARGPGNILYHIWYDNSTGWSTWTSLGGDLVSGPAVTSWGVGRLDVFAVGDNGQIYHIYYNSSSGWSAWENLGGQGTSDPAAVSWGPNRIDLFVRGTDAQLYHKYYDSSGWSAFEALGGDLNSNPAASSWAPGELDVFTRGTDNALWIKYYTLAGGWSGWSSLGGRLTSGPGATSWGPSRIDVFVNGEDNVLYHKFYASPG
jgi:hypothetical protein